MDHEIISISYNDKEYTFKFKINGRKVVRNWITVKVVPAGETFADSYKLLKNDHATIVWNRLADHFYSSNNALMLNDELMTIFINKIREELSIAA